MATARLAADPATDRSHRPTPARPVRVDAAEIAGFRRVVSEGGLPSLDQCAAALAQLDAQASVIRALKQAQDELHVALLVTAYQECGETAGRDREA